MKISVKNKKTGESRVVEIMNEEFEFGSEGVSPTMEEVRRDFMSVIKNLAKWENVPDEDIEIELGEESPVIFYMVEHSIQKGQMLVVILMDNKVVGTIYPQKNGIKIVSVHIDNTDMDEGFAGEILEDDGSGSLLPIPAVHIQFKPSPSWTIKDGKIVKEG